MDRLSLNSIILDNKALVKANKKSRYVFDGEKSDINSLKITFERKAISNILLVNLKEDFNLELELFDDSNVVIEGLLDKANQPLKLEENVAKGAQIFNYFADFSSGNAQSNILINLNGENAGSLFKLASSSVMQDNKTFDVSIIHNTEKTFGLVDNYGVCKSGGRLVFSGISHIQKVAKYSITRQNAKIIVFDKGSDAKARPILKIDNNEIEASHGASVGTVNEDQIFYLTSRGINEQMAKKLITLGYLKPILEGFSDEEMKEKISQLIERRV